MAGEQTPVAAAPAAPDTGASASTEIGIDAGSFGPPASPTQSISSFSEEGIPTLNAEVAATEDAPEVKEGETEVAKTPEAKEEEAPKTPSYKIKAGEDEVELSEDATLEVPVDGKIETVTLKELQKNYSGKVVWEQKFNDLAKEKKMFRDDVALVDRRLNQIYKAFASADPQRGVELLFEMAGPKAKEQVGVIVNKIQENFSKRAAMSEEERDLFDREEALRIKEASIKEEEDAKKEEARGAEIVKKTTDAVNAAGLTMAEFTGAWNKLFDAAKKGVIDLSKVPIDDLPDITIKQAIFDRTITRIDNGIRKVNPELLNDNALREELARVASPDFTEDDIADIVREVHSKKEEGAVTPASETAVKAESSKDLRAASTEATPAKEAPRKKSDDKQTSDEDEDEEIKRLVKASLDSPLF